MTTGQSQYTTVKMIRTTLKEYLSTPNPPLCLNKKTHHVTYTTESIAREPLEGKAEWPDFEVESIQGLFSTVLSQPFDLPAHPTLPPAQLRVRDERCFESVLLSHNCVIVNAALMAATKFMNIPSVTWLVGSYAEQVTDRGKSFPDWAGISGLDPRLNILPGDSKYARQFFDIGEDGKRLNTPIATMRTQMKCLKTIRRQVTFLKAMTAWQKTILRISALHIEVPGQGFLMRASSK